MNETKTNGATLPQGNGSELRSLRRLSMPRKQQPRVARTKDAARSGVGGVPLPLKWKAHPSQDNGWYGVTATGCEVCYVYAPWDNRIRRGPMLWQMFSDFGGLDHPLTGTARYGKFPNSGTAKRAAQKWWRGKMLAMLSGGGGSERQGEMTWTAEKGHNEKISDVCPPLVNPTEKP